MLESRTEMLELESLKALTAESPEAALDRPLGLLRLSALSRMSWSPEFRFTYTIQSRFSFQDLRMTSVTSELLRGRPGPGTASCGFQSLLGNSDALSALKTAPYAVKIPTGDVTIQVGDEVFFLAEPFNIPKIVQELRRHKLRPSRNIMIAGGGNIGFNLAKELEKQHQVKIIDHNITQARQISEQLKHAIVIRGDVADKSLLIEENIDEIDLFLALTNSDEANIISGMLAKKLGVRRVIALVNNQSYVDLIQLNSIDVAISADQITTSRLLHFMRQGDTVKAFTLRRGAAEAMEVIVHGSENSSELIGKTIGEIQWPSSITIGCIVRENAVHFSHRDLTIEAEDHVILFLNDPSQAAEVTELFTPKEKKTWF